MHMTIRSSLAGLLEYAQIKFSAIGYFFGILFITWNSTFLDNFDFVF